VIKDCGIILELNATPFILRFETKELEARDIVCKYTDQRPPTNHFCRPALAIPLDLQTIRSLQKRTNLSIEAGYSDPENQTGNDLLGKIFIAQDYEDNDGNYTSMETPCRIA
jgi:hypothetical protein